MVFFVILQRKRWSSQIKGELRLSEDHVDIIEDVIIVKYNLIRYSNYWSSERRRECDWKAFLVDKLCRK